MMKTVFGIIRHATTSWNLEKRIQGRIDIPLAPVGEVQAGLWAKTLAAIPFDLIVTSPLKRARKTADILAAGFGNGIEVIEEQGLKEQDFGLWEGQTLSEVRTEFPGAIEEQEKKGWQFCPPKGEPRLVVLERSMASLERIAVICRGGRVLLVIHNSVMKLLIYRMLGRKFLPGEPALLKDHHLHWAFRDSGLGIDRLNALALDRVKINDVNG